MTTQTIVCPQCGSVGRVAGRWEKPGVASGEFMDGLDPLNCDGCRKAMQAEGYAVVLIRPLGDGTVDVRPL